MLVCVRLAYIMCGSSCSSLSRDCSFEVSVTSGVTMADKTDRRSERTRATKMFNELAQEFELEELRSRPSATDVVALFESLLRKLSQDRYEEVFAARDLWCDNGGGGDFPESPKDVSEPAAERECSGTVASHSVLVSVAHLN